MRLILNEIRRTKKRERNGMDHLVAPVTPMKAMRLHHGYVPKDEIEKSQPAWNGTPLTLNHPQNSAGQMISVASSPRVEEETRIGTLFNTAVDDDTLTGEAWINTQVARSLGDEGKELVERLENNEAVSVSTSYFGDRLSAGRYDGKHRSTVMGNLRPDHLALLPNKAGRCSIDDGCMVGGLSSNSLQVAGTDDTGNAVEVFNQRDTARTPEYDGTTTQSWSAPDLEDYGFGVSSVEELSQSQREQIANDSLLGEVDAETYATLSYFPVVEPDTNNLSRNALRAVLSGRGQQADIPQSTYESAAQVASDLLGSEFGEEDFGDVEGEEDEPSENAVMRMVNSLLDYAKNFHEDDHPRDGGGKFINKDVEVNSLRDGDVVRVTKRNGDTVEGMHLSTRGDHVTVYDGGTRRISDGTVERIDVVSREAVDQQANQKTMKREEQIKFLVENAGLKEKSLEPMGDSCLENVYNEYSGSDEGGNGDEPATNSTDEYVTKDDLEDVVGNAVTSALESDEREEAIDAITSNSDDYDRDELEETSTSMLKSIKSDVETTTGSAFYGGGGTSPHSSNSDSSEFPALSLNDRLAEQEGDD